MPSSRAVKKTPARSTRARRLPRAPRARRTRATPELAAEIYRRLMAEYPHAHCALNFHDPYQLLVATILSAQCTDERVNKVTPELFRRYPDAAALARSSQADVERIIKSTGFFRAKAKSVRGMAAALIDQFDG